MTEKRKSFQIFGTRKRSRSRSRRNFSLNFQQSNGCAIPYPKLALGYVLFPHHRLVRTRTKQRMKKRLRESYSDYLTGKVDDIQVDRRLQSYLGILSHANQHTLAQTIKNAYWVRTE